MALDPVCKMEIEPAQAAGESRFNDRTYYFCSNDCKERFDENPERYAGEADPSARA